MSPAPYYYVNGYVGWIPFAHYPQWVVSVPYQPPPPLTYAPFILPAPLPTIPTYLPPHNSADGPYYPQQDAPPTSESPQQYHSRISPPPTPPNDVAQDDDDDSIRPVTVIPRPPTPPDPYRRALLDRIRTQADHGVHSISRFAIDTILALPEQAIGTPRLEWDLADNPIRNLTNRQENWWIHTRALARAAVRDGTRGLEWLVLVFAGLPTGGGRDVQIEVTHTYYPGTNTILDAVDGDTVSWVTVQDVFVAIFQWLVSPIGADEMERLEGERFDTVIRAEARRRGRAGRAATASHQPFLKIDYLGERRRFKGIRPALRGEVPGGRRVGEVFVVELGVSG